MQMLFLLMLYGEFCVRIDLCTLCDNLKTVFRIVNSQYCHNVVWRFFNIFVFLAFWGQQESFKTACFQVPANWRTVFSDGFTRCKAGDYADHCFVENQPQEYYKTYTPASNLGYCAPPGQFFMGAKLFIRTPWCKSKVSLKKFGLGYVKMHGFHGNP